MQQQQQQQQLTRPLSIRKRQMVLRDRLAEMSTTNVITNQQFTQMKTHMYVMCLFRMHCNQLLYSHCTRVARASEFPYSNATIPIQFDFAYSI